MLVLPNKEQVTTSIETHSKINTSSDSYCIIVSQNIGRNHINNFQIVNIFWNELGNIKTEKKLNCYMKNY